MRLIIFIFFGFSLYSNCRYVIRGVGTGWAPIRHWADFELNGKHLIVNAISLALKKDCYISTSYWNVRVK